MGSGLDKGVKLDFVLPRRTPQPRGCEVRPPPKSSVERGCVWGGGPHIRGVVASALQHEIEPPTQNK